MMRNFNFLNKRQITNRPVQQVYNGRPKQYLYELDRDFSVWIFVRSFVQLIKKVLEIFNP